MEVELIEIRLLRSTDIAQALRLSQQVGWNQTEKDWHAFISFRPTGCFAAIADNKIVATGTTIDYQQKFSWIGMILVDKEYRRMGIGKMMLQHCIASLDNCETIKLDATPMGKIVYDKLGFVDEYNLKRFIRKEDDISQNARGVERITANNLKVLRDYDREIFAADRFAILSKWWSNHQENSFIYLANNRLYGYVLCRQGMDSLHIGPLLADNDEIAEKLLCAVLKGKGRQQIIIDSMVENHIWLAILQKYGFEELRPFIRMAKGPNNYPGNLCYQYAISGPELG